ncbi:MAG: hypothetical protein R3C20_20200 [Planctomycetaceae bacterium]
MQTAAIPSPVSFDPIAHAAIQSARLTEAVKGILLCSAYYAVAHLRLFSVMDGAIFLAAASLLLPAWRPYLLLIGFSVQDARGQIVPFDYAAVAAMSGLLMLSAAISGSEIPLTRGLRHYRHLVLMGILLVGYGLVTSTVNHTMGIRTQFESRPYYIVCILMASMIFTAWLATRQMYMDAFGSTRIKVVAVCILIHIFFIAIMQFRFGPAFAASPQGMAEIIKQDQASNPGVRGVARLTGPFLSPNALASVPAFYMLMLLGARRARELSMLFVAGFFVTGITAAALGAARTMFVYYLAAAAAMTWTRSPSKTMLAMFLALPMVLLVNFDVDGIMTVMRLKNLNSLGARGELWQCAIDNLGWAECLFGMGVSHFPNMYYAGLGHPSTDPHTWILSMIGMFGISGVIVYLLICWRIYRFSRTQAASRAAMGVALAVFLFGRELGNTQYLFNHHPLCCLYWTCIGFVFVRPGEFFESRDDVDYPVRMNDGYSAPLPGGS